MKSSTDNFGVQLTATDALLSKVMMSEKGYFTDNYAYRLFTGKKRKLLPIINRGTWARVESVFSVLSKFIDKFPKGQVLSLGAGFDSNYFILKEKYPEAQFWYFEIDFQEIIKQKIQRIGKQKELLQKVKQEDSGLNLVAADLRHITASTIAEWKIDQTLPTLIIAEVVLVYIDGKEVNQLLNTLSSYFKDCAFLVYEMIQPSDPFGKMMVANLEERGCPLRGIYDAPDLEAQIARYSKSAKCDKVFAQNMLTLYDSYLNQEEKARIQKIEFFDQYEEWQLLQQHYCLVFAVKNGDSLLNSLEPTVQKSLQTPVPFLD